MALRNRTERKVMAEEQEKRKPKKFRMRGALLRCYFAVLLVCRLWSAMQLPILDCDETYNYWEPLHLLCHGSGLQTWEYSPRYALRSYAFLLPFWPVVKVCQLLRLSKMVQFYAVRTELAVFAALADVLLTKTVAQNISRDLALMELLISAVSTGMFIASTALLPSSVSMTLTTFAYGFWIARRHFLAVFCIALSSLLVWPFAGLVGVPIALDMLWKKQIFKFLLYSASCLIGILAFMVPVDSFLYGKLVVAPVNILAYNVFSEYGSELYGTEPLLFYVKNLLLNWNVGAVLACLSVPLFLLRQNLCLAEPVHARYSRLVQLAQCGMWLWIVVFFLQPHKEERFLFPLYPLISINVAVSLECLKCLLSGRRYCSLKTAILVTFCLVSISRNVFICNSFSAPMSAYSGVRKGMVCVGKEWYRFPSSFFLPTDSRLGFLRSEFRGLLPKPYAEAESLVAKTRLVPTEMNDRNKEEPSRYVNMTDCDYLVDLSDGSTGSELEPDYAAMKRTWKVDWQGRFLLLKKSDVFCKYLSIPFLRTRCPFADYVLLSSLR